MSKYIAVARILFKAQMAYRFDVIMTAVSMVWRVAFAWILWNAIYASRDTVGGFTLQAMLSYYLINSFLATMDMSSGVSSEVSNRIKEGTYSKFMVIPSNPQLHFLSQTAGASLYYGLFAVMAAVLSAFVFRINMVFTTDPVHILLAFAVFLLGTVFMNSFQFFVGIWAFKFQDVSFLLYTFPAIIQFFRGEFVPLTLLPAVLVDALRFFPFTHISFTPTMLLTGRMDSSEGLFGLAVLGVWTLVMMAVCELTYNRLRIKYEGVGI
jgi:ABC-2 type transport system permease protein